MGIKQRWDPGTWLEELLDLGNLGPRCWNVVKENWYLGFTSFGGPPVHFKIVSFSLSFFWGGGGYLNILL